MYSACSEQVHVICCTIESRTLSLVPSSLQTFDVTNLHTNYLLVDNIESSRSLYGTIQSQIGQSRHVYPIINKTILRSYVYVQSYECAVDVVGRLT